MLQRIANIPMILMLKKQTKKRAKNYFESCESFMCASNTEIVSFLR